MLIVLQSNLYPAGREVTLRSKANVSAGSPAQKAVNQAKVSSIKANGFTIKIATDSVTGKVIGSKVTRPDGTKRLAKYDPISNSTLRVEFDATGNVAGRSKVNGGIDLSSAAVAKIASSKPIEKLIPEQDRFIAEKDTQLSSLASKLVENVESNKGAQYQPSGWTKSAMYETARQAVRDFKKGTGQFLEAANNAVKDLSLSTSKSLFGSKLSKEEQDFMVRGERMQIQRVGKKISEIKKDKQNDQSRLDLAQEGLKQAQEKKDLPSIRIYKKDIAEYNQMIHEKQAKIESLEFEQKRLMADKFDSLGNLISQQAVQEIVLSA